MRIRERFTNETANMASEAPKMLSYNKLFIMDCYVVRRIIPVIMKTMKMNEIKKDSFLVTDSHHA